MPHNENDKQSNSKRSWYFDGRKKEKGLVLNDYK
jgi:hypothetical protein